MPVATLWRLLLVSCSLLVVLAGVATTPVSAVTAPTPGLAAAVAPADGPTAARAGARTKECRDTVRRAGRRAARQAARTVGTRAARVSARRTARKAARATCGSTTEPTTEPTAEPTADPTIEPVIEPTPDPSPGDEPGHVPPGTYHVDPVGGSDAADGTTPATAWRTLVRASAASLAPGEVLRLRAGVQHLGGLVLTEDGTATDPIRVEPYGDGAAPLVSDDGCVLLQGDWAVVTGVHAHDCGRAGFRVEGADVLLTGVEASGNVAGVWVREGALRATVEASYVHDNDLMAPGTDGPDDDYGAFGIEVNGDDTRVVGNRISGHHAPSPDYRVDGAAVEVYQARGTLVQGNTSTDDLAFTELGGSRTSGTRVVGNTVTSSAEEGTFLMTRGPGQVWGPVVDTVAEGNTVRLTGAKSYGFGCYGGCTPTHLVLTGNDITAGWYVGWVDGTFTTTGNTYRGELWFTLGEGDTWSP